MDMNREKMLEYILDSIPYVVTFVDKNFIIRYMNKASRYCNYDQLAYPDLIGRCILDCHPEAIRPMILAVVEKFKNHVGEIFLKVNDANERMYITPVRDEKGEFIGFYERCERNLYLDPDQNRSFKLRYNPQNH